jgi:hypothetical protein
MESMELMERVTAQEKCREIAAILFVDADRNLLGENVVARIVGEAGPIDELVTKLLEDLSFSDRSTRLLLQIADRTIKGLAMCARSEGHLTGRGQGLDCR